MGSSIDKVKSFIEKDIFLRDKKYGEMLRKKTANMTLDGAATFDPMTFIRMTFLFLSTHITLI